jgi:hypothetical protein
MSLFTIENLTIEEIAALRQSLNVIDIKGSSAQFIANLQVKLENKINQAQSTMQQEHFEKQEGIKTIEKTTKLKV